MDNEIVYLYLDDIIPNRFQPREMFDEKALKELAVSIKEHGVIQPIIVRKIGTKYEIIAGERRYKASTLAGLTKIPAVIRNLDDKESSKVALIENLQRKDLTPIEEARTYQKILDIDNMTQEDLAKTMGKSQSAVSNKLRLLTLSNKIQDALLNEKISERHARSLLNLEDEKERDMLTDIIIDKRLSVKELDEMIRNKDTVPIVKESEKVVEEEKPKEEVVEEKEEEDSFVKFNEQFRPEIKSDFDDDKIADFNKILLDLVKEKEAKEEHQEKVQEETRDKGVEVLDLDEDDNYYSFKGLKKVNSTDIDECVNIIRDAVAKVEKLGYVVKNDELDLESQHRFIIEIDKKDNR